MQAERNVELVRQFCDHVSKGDFKKLGEAFTDDAIWWSRLGEHTKDQWVASLEMLSSAAETPPAMKILTLTAQDNRVAAEVDGRMQMKDGRVYDNAYHYLFVFEGDKIKLVRDHMDTAHTLSVFGDGG